MRCPICPNSTLALIALEAQLPGHTCLRCGGVWVASSDYWAWLERPTEDSPAETEPGTQPTGKAPGARRCAGCGHIMLRYPVARDLPFQLDQCGHCNSFWLDCGEWALLRERGLHRRLHQITNAPWQRQLRQESQRAAWEQIYTERFGTEDYAEESGACGPGSPRTPSRPCF